MTTLVIDVSFSKVKFAMTRGNPLLC